MILYRLRCMEMMRVRKRCHPELTPSRVNHPKPEHASVSSEPSQRILMIRSPLRLVAYVPLSFRVGGRVSLC